MKYALLLLASWASWGQTSDTATVRGRVADQSGAALTRVLVTATNEQTGLQRNAESDDAGLYTLSALPVSGAYRLSAARKGFAYAAKSGITLASGSTATVDIELTVLSARNELTVFGDAGDVRPDQPQLGIHLRADDIQLVPLLNRHLTFLPLLNASNRPALNQGDVFMNQNLFTSNGGGRRQTWFEIDGTSGSDSWGRQTIFTNLPLDAVEEMEVLTNAFSAEYGVLPGGKTQLFAALEYGAQDRSSPVTSPVAPGSFVGKYRDWLGLLRVDRQLNDRHSLFLRLNGDAFRDTNPNGTVGGNSLPTVDRVFRRRTYAAELGETFVLSPAVVNSLRLQFQLGSPITQFDPVAYGTQYSIPISTGGTFVTGTSQSALLMNRQYQVADTLSVAKGRHQFKFGAALLYVHTGGDSKEFGGPIYLGQFSYKICTQPLSICESPTYLKEIRNVQSYTQTYGNGSYRLNDQLWSAFMQDDFHVRPDLTINLGLRYELQTFTDSTRNFAPRAGFAYDWAGSGHTILRSGFGIYHSQIVDNAEANYALSGPNGVFNYTAGPGQIGFPLSVSAVPLATFPSGAVMPVRSIYIRPAQLLRPYTEQWTFGVEQKLGSGWVAGLDYVGSHSIRINRALDVDAPAPFVRTVPGQVRTAQAANCTRPYWVSWYAQRGITCNPLAVTNPQPPYGVIQTDVNNGFGTYHALNFNVSRRFSRGASMLASYTWSHAINNVDPDLPNQNPNDAYFTGAAEKASAIFDQRQRLVLSGVYTAPLRIEVGGIATLGSALPFNYLTGVTNSGDTGATADRPVINGVVVGRNIGRGRPIYDLSPFVQRRFALGQERLSIEIRAEAFNVLNHPNFVGYSTTYGNGAAPGPGFGQPLAGITNQLPARSFQFSAKVLF